LGFVRRNLHFFPKWLHKKYLRLIAANFKVWQESMKYKLSSCGSNIWRLVCEGYDGDFPSSKVLNQNSQARRIIFKKLHNADLEKVGDLKYAKEVWDRLHMLFG